MMLTSVHTSHGSAQHALLHAGALHKHAWGLLPARNRDMSTCTPCIYLIYYTCKAYTNMYQQAPVMSMYIGLHEPHTCLYVCILLALTYKDTYRYNYLCS